MRTLIPSLQKDCYKEYHVRAYHPDVEYVYSNFTNRSGKHTNIPGSNKVLFVGLQYFILDYLIHEWNEGFFNKPKEVAVERHRKTMSSILGKPVDVGYLEKLHDLGYLPLKIKALPEGTLVPYQVAPITITNTHPGFAWLPNMIETVMSTENWPIQTAATTAYAYFRNFKYYMEKTGGPIELIPFLGHDFSFRGIAGRHAAAMTGFGHLAAGFVGTDTIPAVIFSEEYYNADCNKELIGASVDATEHSVTCSWQNEGEIEFIRYLIKEHTPTGILSIVADTWDFWKLVTEFLPVLKDEIMARDGTVVIRPDSGDPVKILTGYKYEEVNKADPGHVITELHSNWPEAVKCGNKYYEIIEDINGAICGRELEEFEIKGLVECLWEIFGGSETNKGYKLLDSHIGAIYGDSITIQRQEAICQRLVAKKFVPSVVLGIGSYTYQFVTRDTHGSAVKATNVIKNGKHQAIWKDPKTDPGKKSAKGLLRVDRDENGEIVMYDSQTPEQEEQGLLEVVFLDGKLTKTTTLAEIRELVASQL